MRRRINTVKSRQSSKNFKDPLADRNCLCTIESVYDHSPRRPQNTVHSMNAVNLESMYLGLPIVPLAAAMMSAPAPAHAHWHPLR
jgi:hypothetical protein